MLNELRIGLIGCGKQAPKHISGLRRLPGVRLVLADTIPEAAHALAEKESLEWLPHPDAVLTDASIQAVDICTPTPTHAGLIRGALAAGKDFFCEKPLCADLGEARGILESLRTHRQVGMVGYVYRFAPVFELARRLCRPDADSPEAGVLGPIRFARFRLGGRGSHQPWKHQRATQGGAANEMLVHMLDLALWFFGEPTDARLLQRALLRPEREFQGQWQKVDADDYIAIELQFASGVLVECQADLLTPSFTQYVELQGDRGGFLGSIMAEFPGFLFTSVAANGWKTGYNPLCFPATNLFEAEMAAFVHAIRTRKQPDRCTVEDAVRIMQLMEKLQ